MTLLTLFIVASILVMFVASTVWTLFIVALKHRSLTAHTKEERIAAEERMWSLVRIGLWIMGPWLAITVLVGFLHW